MFVSVQTAKWLIKGKIQMNIQKINDAFSICKVTDYSQVDFTDDYCFIGKTDEEYSLVCKTDSVPNNVICCDNGWKAFRIKGELDFFLVGVLSRISVLMADNCISIFAVSTYNTDYFFIRQKDYSKAIHLLSVNGYEIV